MSKLVVQRYEGRRRGHEVRAELQLGVLAVIVGVGIALEARFTGVSPSPG